VENGEVKDFTKKRKILRFKVDDDIFDCVPGIPAGVAVDLTRLATTRPDTPAEIMSEFRETFAAVLLPESLDLFMARLVDRANPIEADQLGEILPWLLEQYGFRPTRPSGDSSQQPTNPASGTSSTDGVPSPELTPSGSPSLDF
jgi:hypothetical protein